MSIAEHFDDGPDAGFTRRYDATTARRQLRVSAALLIVLAFATIVLGLLAR